MLANGWISSSPVQIYVSRCCEPSLSEPNYALNLELAEYIQQKKANTPREAAMAIAQHVNHRNPHVALLAIALLRTLVQAVGYAFHLQIATKEFLNELVRRFPERPPPFPGPVMSGILDIIHEWRETICKDSRYKEDLGNIRDMHRLLTFKGYRFKDVSKSSSYVEAANANLKSPEELENEDREAQQAKLQELIRRGTPRDLAAAQELMKSLAGANPEAKPDYRSQTLAELEKLQAKVILLNDLLDNVDTSRGEKFVPGDAYDQVASVCKQARPKIQKWISDASGESDEPGDTESLETFLHMNDLINNVLERYERYKQGDYSAQPVAQTAGGSGGGAKTDLINFDMDDSSASNAAGSGAPATGGTSGIDDLAELFGPPATSAAPPTVSTFNLFGPPAAPPVPSAGFGFNQMPFQQQHPQHPQLQTQMQASAAPLRPFGYSTPPPGAASSSSSFMPGTLGGIALPTTPNQSRSMTPNVGGSGMMQPQAQFGTGIGMGNGLGMGMASGMMPFSQPMHSMQAQPLQLHQQPQQQQPPQQETSKATGKDPFADLAGLF